MLLLKPSGFHYTGQHLRSVYSFQSFLFNSPVSPKSEPLKFVQHILTGRVPSCHPTNSNKALKRSLKSVSKNH